MFIRCDECHDCGKRMRTTLAQNPVRCGECERRRASGGGGMIDDAPDFAGLGVDDVDAQSLRLYRWLDKKREDALRELAKWRAEQRDTRTTEVDGPTARQVHESRHGIPCAHGDDPLACDQCSTTEEDRA